MSNSKHPIILYVLIGLLVVAIAIGPIYGAFSDSTNEQNNDSIHEHAFDFNQVSEMGQDGTELIYRYHPQCAFCAEIEGDVYAFAESNTMDMPLQQVHIEHEENLPSGLVTGVPTLLIVEDGQIVDELVGPNPILDLFERVNSGDYSSE